MNNKQIFIPVFLLLIIFSFLVCDNKSTDPQEPVLSVSPITIDFGMDQIGLRFFISNKGGSTLEWSIQNGSQTWYQCTPSSGLSETETDTVIVTVDRSGLSGELADTLSVISNGGNISVEILMQVSTSPTLSVFPSSLDLGAVENTGYFLILNSGPGLLEWSVSENIDWLELSPDTGSSAGEEDTITVSIQRPNLSNDNLSGEILVSSNGGSQTIGVSVRDTVFASEGIYGFLTLERNITRHHMGNVRDDIITARIDSVNSPCEPAIPLAADSVYCSGYTLLWNAANGNYVYDQTMPRTFLNLGETYFFGVVGNSSVPYIADSVTFPLYAPYLTSPVDSSQFSRNADLGVEWTEIGENQVTISLIISTDSICTIPYETAGLYGLNFETANDGQFVILSTHLAGLVPGEYRLVLTNSNAHAIPESGYNSSSYIMAKTTSYVTVYLQ